MVSRAQYLHLGLVGVGVLLVGVASVQLVQPDYTVHVEPVPAGAVPADASPIRFENLSSTGQDAVRDAIRSADGSATVDAGNRPPAFTYGDGSDDHYVASRDEYYRVTTGGGGVLSRADELVGYVLLAFGAVAILVGGRDFYRHRAGAE